MHIFRILNENIQNPIQIKPIIDTENSEPLIKYGFNPMIDKLEISKLEEKIQGIDQRFDFSKKEQKEILKKTFGLKDMNIDEYKYFCVFWEIYALFLINNKTLTSGFGELTPPLSLRGLTIETNQEQALEPLENAIKKTTKNKVSVRFSGDPNVIFMTDIGINEIQNIISKMNNGCSLIIQIFKIQTQIIIELFYFLSTLFAEKFIIKPTVISDMSDEKYIVLLNYSGGKIKIPKLDQYTKSLSINPSPEFEKVIKKVNSELDPRKIIVYNKVKKFIDQGFYQGDAYNELLQKQEFLLVQWLDIVTNTEKIKDLVDK